MNRPDLPPKIGRDPGCSPPGAATPMPTGARYARERPHSSLLPSSKRSPPMSPPEVGMR